MKNKLLFSLFVLLFFNSSAQNMLNLKSKNAVSEETARIVGAKFMGFNPGVSYRSGDTLVLDTVFKTSNGENAIYVFNTAGGFVMVAADIRVTPVVAYSKESQFSCENMPESLQKLLDSYVSQIKFVMDSVKTSEYSHSLSSWYQYVSESQQYTSRNHNVVQPLLTTTWNQNHPYNLLCPADPAGPEGHVYAGCVATALAQIFKYWSQPANGLGSNSYNCNFTSEGYGNYGFLSVDFTTGNYNYNMMPNSLSNATSEEIAEVAKLIYHCGVAVEMKYGANGSGAFDSKALSALKNFFGYTTAQLVKKTAYTDPEWKSLLKSELLQMRPVYYSGSGSSGGHAFVCDGFDENDMFHFNWGWSGSNNGYYTLTSLTPGNKNFSSGQTAIIGIDAAQPKIRASKHAVSFLSPCGTVSESKSVFIISTSLVQTINATVVGNFGVSIDSSTYLQNLDINSTGGKLYIRHNGSEVGATEQGLLILSSGSATDTVYLTGNTFVDVFDCLPPQNLVISTQDLQHINLNWNSPTVDHDPKYLSWSSENVSVFSGYASYYRFTMLQRYSETDILPYHNKSITAIRFYADAEASLFKAVVYSGGSFEGGFNPGTLVYSQDIDRSSLNLNGWNTITLDTSVIVDAAQELCFGIYLEAPAGTYAIPRCSGGVAYKGCVYGYHSSNSVSWNEYSQEYTYPLGVIVENAQKVVDYTILRDGSILGTTNDPFYQDYVDSSKTFNYTVVANWSNNCSDSIMKSFKNVAQILSVPERVDIFTNYGYGLNVKKVVIAGCGLESSIHAFVDGDFQISSDSVNYSSFQTLPASGGALFVRYSPSSSSEQFESGLLILSSDNIVTNVPITAQIYNECTPPKNLLLSQNGNNISLTWESPDLQTVQQYPLSWYESPGNLSYGSNSSEIKRYIVHRFDTNDLAHYHGKQLTSVSFIPHNSVTTYKIVVYKGGSERTSQYFSSGTKIVEQDVDISTLTAGEWNSIQLQNPVMVDASQELWYGVYLESPKGSYPIQLGTPYVAKKGLITKPSTNPDNYWTEYSVNSLSYCFSLKSTIEDVPNTLSKFLIDRNEIEVGETNENYYSDTLIYNGGYDYRVWALWNDGCKVAISDSIFVADLCDREGFSFSEESCNEYVWNDVTYLESGTYYHSYLLPNGCLSTDTLHLTINTAQHQSQTHTAIDSYVWNGTTYTESGTYMYSHTDENGCDQVDTLHLTIYRSAATEFSVSACDSYTWNAETYTSSGDYEQTFQTAHGADSIVTLHLTINNGTFNAETVAECGSYEWQGETYTESGTYVHEYTNDDGCQSADTLHLTINNSITENTELTICSSELPYNWRDTIFGAGSESGDYVFTRTAANGCDSVVTLHLTINNSVTEIAEQTICSSELPYTWRDTIFGAGSESGDYMFTKTAANGCDSVVTLHLTINNSVTEETNLTICSSELPYTWRDTIFGVGSESGDYMFTKTAANGCDSVVTLHLTINNSVTENTKLTICSSELPYIWRDTIFGAGSESGDYMFTKTTSNGCDSVVTLQLTINNSVTETTELTICSSELPYNWRDTVFGAGSESGDYVFTKTTSNGCDSVVTLHLTINSGTFNSEIVAECGSYGWQGETYTVSGTYVHEYTNDEGCQSTDTLHLTINNPVTKTAEQTICSSELPYTWRDTIFGAGSESGDYVFTKTAANGCDSVVTLHLTINTPQHQSQTHTAIDSYAWNGTTYTVSGTYMYSHTDENGCEQVDTLHLTLHYSTANEIYATACDNYTWNAETYTSSGNYVQTFLTSHGADSVVTLHLTINNPVTETAEQTICSSELPYTWRDTIFGAGSESGDYVFTKTAANGCDSVVTLHLTINSGTFNSEIVAECGSYEWHGATYTESGTYVYEYTNDGGCQSADTLHLIINNSVTETTEQTICSSELPYTWRDTIFGAGSESGDYVFTKSAANGCDSVVTLHLIINSGTFNSETVAECGSYEWHWETYTVSGTYVHEYTNDDGCQSADTLHLTINNSVTEITELAICSSELPYTWRDTIFGAGSESGDYVFMKTAANGCDSVVTLHLTINAPQHQSQTHTAIDSYVWNGTTYTESGTYTYSHTDENGCEQVDTLHLTLHYSTANEIYATACDNYTWNAETYTSSGDYEQTFLTTHGADSVVTLHLTINSGTFNSETVTECGSYEWYGATYTESGTYVHEYTNDKGCQSADTLHLTINNPVSEIAEQTICSNELPYTWRDTVFGVGSESGDYMFTKTAANGCDSVVTLHLTINTPQHQSQTHTAIDSYAWNGTTYTESGTYTYSHTDVNGCEQVDTLHLTVHYSTANEVYATACDNYTWNAETYTLSGDYEQTFLTTHGADSIVTLHLTINSGTFNSETVAECGSYEWQGETYTESGTYVHEYTNDVGCQSADTLHLIINNSVTETAEQTICSSELPYTWRDTVFGAGSESGDYVFTKTAANGCDSIVTLHLTINAPQHQSQTHTAIDSYAWNGTTYTESGTYTYSHTDENGCEQVDTLHLTLHYSTANEVYATACDNYTWNAETYTSSGDYEQTFQTAHGADSVVTLHLTINNSVTEITYLAICSSELPYIWRDTVFGAGSESGDYVFTKTAANGCDSVVTLHLTINNSFANDTVVLCQDSCFIWNGLSYCESGDYVQEFTALNGCDSLVTLHLTIVVGINDLNNNKPHVVVYPNPATDILKVDFDCGGCAVENAVMQIVDMYGKVVWGEGIKKGEAAISSPYNTNFIDVSHLANGVYLLRITTGDGSVAKAFVKQ